MRLLQSSDGAKWWLAVLYAGPTSISSFKIRNLSLVEKIFSKMLFFA